MRKNSTKTLAHLIGAMDNQTAVSIRYVKSDGTVSRRTIEVHSFEVTKAGNITLRAWDRRDEEMTTFRLDRITHYTLHRATSKIARYTNLVEPVEGVEEVVTVVEAADDEVYTTGLGRWTSAYELVS